MPTKPKSAKAEPVNAEDVTWLYIIHPDTGVRYSVRPDRFTAEGGYQSQGFVVEYTDTGAPWGDFQPSAPAEPTDGGGEDMLQTPASTTTETPETEP